jgi:hypothetical protein
MYTVMRTTEGLEMDGTHFSPMDSTSLQPGRHSCSYPTPTLLMHRHAVVKADLCNCPYSPTPTLLMHRHAVVKVELCNCPDSPPPHTPSYLIIPSSMTSPFRFEQLVAVIDTLLPALAVKPCPYTGAINSGSVSELAVRFPWHDAITEASDLVKTVTV